jgi:[ribosomal protein S18]-alanine N-acetyltransferase
VQIRPANLADVTSMMLLDRQSATAAHWTEDQYRQALQPGSTPRLVLVIDESSPTAPTPEAGTGILGFLIAQHISPEWELENIVVAANARRKGLGKRLLQHLLSAAHEINSASVFLEVRESNTAARALYEKAGFAQIGRRKIYYTNPPEDAVLYRRNLP